MNNFEKIINESVRQQSTRQNNSRKNELFNKKKKNKFDATAYLKDYVATLKKALQSDDVETDNLKISNKSITCDDKNTYSDAKAIILAQTEVGSLSNEFEDFSGYDIVAVGRPFNDKSIVCVASFDNSSMTAYLEVLTADQAYNRFKIDFDKKHESRRIRRKRYVRENLLNSDQSINLDYYIDDIVTNLLKDVSEFCDDLELDENESKKIQDILGNKITDLIVSVIVDPIDTGKIHSKFSK